MQVCYHVSGAGTSSLVVTQVSKSLHIVHRLNVCLSNDETLEYQVLHLRFC